ncbi:hypothetical protein MUP32_00745 [Candidatus Microgenomates bacterium]|nr:hypothetical protein [Candidatus Microgenomates bacterium]
MYDNLIRERRTIPNNIETMGVNGSQLPPLLDWGNKPVHIPEGRPKSFFRYQTAKGVKMSELDAIYSHIRYIDEETTNKALEALAGKLSDTIGKNPYVLVHYGENDTSGHWISRRLIEEYGLDKGILPSPISIHDFMNKMKDGLPPGIKIIIADDLMIYGEQIAQHMVEPLQKKFGMDISKDIIVGALASTDFILDNVFTRGILDKVRLSRVFKVPTMRQENIRNPFLPNDSYILTFFHHRVSDRMLPPLVRSYSQLAEDGKYYWLIDDMCVPPPYDLERFTSGGWSAKTKETPKEL